jgi:3-deoxy-manno-octulosonate cytidylyltransferase (CMP-KDO synthetase)
MIPGAPAAGAGTAVPGPPGSADAALSFIALIPARLGSSRLPDKPLADIHGLPMVVRVARRAVASGARRVVVCADSARILEACHRHGVHAILTDDRHPTGTDRLAEACRLLQLEPHEIVVNVQGDEPLIPPGVIRQVAAALAADPGCDIATAAHALHAPSEFFDPNVVKVVCNGQGRALLFSRAPIPWSREAFTGATPGALAVPGHLPAQAPAQGSAPMPQQLPEQLPALRHVGLYAYRVGFLLRFPTLSRPAIEEHESLEQLRALYHGCAIAVMELAGALPPGVDTPADLERVRAASAMPGCTPRHAERAAAEDRP